MPDGIPLGFRVEEEQGGRGKKGEPIQFGIWTWSRLQRTKPPSSSDVLLLSHNLKRWYLFFSLIKDDEPSHSLPFVFY